MLETEVYYVTNPNLVFSSIVKITESIEESMILRGLLHWIATRNGFAMMMGKPLSPSIHFKKSVFLRFLDNSHIKISAKILTASLKSLENRKFITVLSDTDTLTIQINTTEIEATCRNALIQVEGLMLHTNHRWVDDIDPKLSQDELWDALPGASKGLPKVTLSDVVNHQKEMSLWAQQPNYKLQHAPVDIVEISFMIFKITGLEPTLKQWINQVIQIKAVVSGDMTVLEAGLRAGVKARNEQGLTMGQPSSYMNYIQNAKALSIQGGNMNGTSGVNKNGVIIA